MGGSGSDRGLADELESWHLATTQPRFPRTFWKRVAQPTTMPTFVLRLYVCNFFLKLKISYPINLTYR